MMSHHQLNAVTSGGVKVSAVSSRGYDLLRHTGTAQREDNSVGLSPPSSKLLGRPHCATERIPGARGGPFSDTHTDAGGNTGESSRPCSVMKSHPRVSWGVVRGEPERKKERAKG